MLPFAFDQSTRYRLLNGLDDIGLTLQHEDAIAAYEAPRQRPADARDAVPTSCAPSGCP